ANKLTTSANAIFLQYTSPVWVMLMAALILKEKIRRSDCITVIAVLLGMALFFVGGFGGGTPLGNVIALTSGVFQAGLVIVTKKQKAGSPVEIALLGNFLTFFVSLPFIPHKIPDTTSILALLFLGVFQLGIPYIFYMLAIKRVTSVEALLIPVLEPLLNPVWVFLFTGEKVAITALIGGTVVICSVVMNELVSAWKKKNIQTIEASKG
ncbi:MAG: EamA family transporter, partial [Clostridiales bacterium]|nr:EamA family transporter [Clostridiales bacterium]